MSDHNVFIKAELKRAYQISIVAALMMTGMSFIGVFFPDLVYPSPEFRDNFLTNDVINLFIGLPVLIVAIWLARRGKLIGLLFWPGALLYATYNDIAYAIAMPFSWPFAIFLLLVFTTAYSAFLVIRALDLEVIAAQLTGKVPVRFTAVMLIILGTLILILAIVEIAGALTSTGPIPMLEIAVRIADLVMLPLWVAGGVSLLRRKPFGYTSAAGLLFMSSMLFIGLLVFFVLQPIMTDLPFPTVDFVVVLVMGMISFVPFGLYLRGVGRADS
jgi:hypothetical protein